MTITFDILGEPGRDNAMLVRIDSGQSVERLLFDCGDGCLDTVSFADIQAIDHLFFSHLHMDHVGGFDHFFRCVFDRETKPNHIWGPPETARILQHRFRGFLWNLSAEMAGTWSVSDIHPDGVSTTRFELAEAFEIAHHGERSPAPAVLLDRPTYTVEAHAMEHRTPTIAYIVREKPRWNIETGRLAALGMRPGPWMKILKDPSDPTATVSIAGVEHRVSELRETLLVQTPGDSLAYLTDFLLDDAATVRLASALHGCQTVVCESQYRHADLELARKNFHMTTRLTGQLAKHACISKLVLFHLSDRYQRHEWLEMLAEVREQFSNTEFPVNWGLLGVSE